ncbi:MAG: Mur ligase family protein [Planctomycetota bacterium]
MSTSFSNDGSDTATISLREFLDEAVFVGADDITVQKCVDRADQCSPGDVFIPRHNAHRDEHDKVEEAIRRGAVAVVSDRVLPVSVPQCLVENTQEVFAKISQRLHGDPSKRMLTIGIVGTSAKSATALYVSSMLKQLGGSVAYYTSLGSSDSIECDRSNTRPPGAQELAEWMQRSDLSGAPAVVIELTPSMLRDNVAAGVEFDLIILTGMRTTQTTNGASVRCFSDLLNSLMDRVKAHGMLLYNADDALAVNWVEKQDIASVSYGLDAAEHVCGKRLSREGGQQQLLVMAGNMLMPLTLQIPGDHIARSALAAIATAWMFDFSVPDSIAGVEKLTSIPGRLQRIPQSVEVPVFIDIGATPDRVAVATHALRQHNYGPATVVVDLNNQLDSKWRSRLGEVLEKAAHRVVLTGSDLSPSATQRLAMDVLGGCSAPGRIQVIPDRAAAIRWAIDRTNQGVVLLSGCGELSWTDRDGESVSDEMLAKLALDRKNKVAAPKLGVFPPADSNHVFPIDS